jgi:alanyl-tRNA synthetase
LRLIAIDEFDLSACGGTHVSRTGAIGMIAIAGTEKFRGGTRVEFLCGGRALARFRSWRDAFAATQRVLSVAPAELAAGIERLQGDSKTLQRTIRSLQEELAGYQAKTLVSNAESIRDRLVFTKAMEGWDAVGLKALAAAAVAEEPRLALALITTSSPALVVVARGKDAAIDAGAVLKQLVARFGGRGGGKPDLAQGGGLTGGSTEIVQFARDILAGG